MAGPDPKEREPSPAGWHQRGTEEFSRVLAFSDGLFAIAMTLLVVGISLPTLRVASDEGEMARALGDLGPQILSFVISFAVIGRYWHAHHSFFAILRAVDSRLITINLVYLAFIAFLPFPTGLLGSYFDNPLSVAFYAAMVGCVSGLEVVLLWHAHRVGLLRRQMPAHIYRWGVLLSLLPVGFFAASVPVAFVSPPLAVSVWFLAALVQLLVETRKPADIDQYFD